MSSNNKRFYIIVNPAARGGRCGPSFFRDILPLLNSRIKVKPEIMVSTHPLHCTGLAALASNNEEAVVAVVGGDGTVNDVIQSMSLNAVLIPFPAGNANDFSRRMGYRNIGSAIDSTVRILNSQENSVHRVDIGLIQYPSRAGLIEKRFVNHFGWGVSADVVHALHGHKLKLYKTRAIYEVLRKPAEAVELFASGRKLGTKAFGIEFLLASKVGRDVNFAPYKIPNDGCMDIIMFEDMKMVDRLDLIAKLRFGRMMVKKQRVQYISSNKKARGCSRSRRTKVRSATLATFKPGNYHVDGNRLGDIHCSPDGDFILVRVLPKALRVAEAF